jgi:hypothetical protein
LGVVIIETATRSSTAPFLNVLLVNQNTDSSLEWCFPTVEVDETDVTTDFVENLVYTTLSIKIVASSYIGSIQFSPGGELSESIAVDYFLCRPLSVSYGLDFIARRIETNAVRWMKYKEAEDALSSSPELEILNKAYLMLAEEAALAPKGQ